MIWDLTLINNVACTVVAMQYVSIQRCYATRF
jgi:hypothetical protein